MRRRARWAAVLWVVVAAALWLGVYDYVNKRAHEEYLRRSAELRLGIQPPPDVPVDLRGVLGEGRRGAAIQATAWAAVILGAGWGTVWALRAQKV